MAAELRERAGARERAETAPIQDVVMLLRAILGPQLVQSVSGARTATRVAGWAQGSSRPSSAGEARLRIALELALTIVEAEGLEAARGWIVRRDPELGGRSPLGVLAEDRLASARRTLLAAAQASVRRGNLTGRLVPLGPPRT